MTAVTPTSQVETTTPQAEGSFSFDSIADLSLQEAYAAIDKEQAAGFDEGKAITLKKRYAAHQVTKGADPKKMLDAYLGAIDIDHMCLSIFDAQGGEGRPGKRQKAFLRKAIINDAVTSIFPPEEDVPNVFWHNDGQSVLRAYRQPHETALTTDLDVAPAATGELVPSEEFKVGKAIAGNKKGEYIHEDAEHGVFALSHVLEGASVAPEQLRLFNEALSGKLRKLAKSSVGETLAGTMASLEVAVQGVIRKHNVEDAVSAAAVMVRDFGGEYGQQLIVCSYGGNQVVVEYMGEEQDKDRFDHLVGDPVSVTEEGVISVPLAKVVRANIFSRLNTSADPQVASASYKAMDEVYKNDDAQAAAEEVAQAILASDGNNPKTGSAVLMLDTTALVPEKPVDKPKARVKAKSTKTKIGEDSPEQTKNLTASFIKAAKVAGPVVVAALAAKSLPKGKELNFKRAAAVATVAAGAAGLALHNKSKLANGFTLTRLIEKGVSTKDIYGRMWKTLEPLTRDQLNGADHRIIDAKRDHPDSYENEPDYIVASLERDQIISDIKKEHADEVHLTTTGKALVGAGVAALAAGAVYVGKKKLPTDFSEKVTQAARNLKTQERLVRARDRVVSGYGQVTESEQVKRLKQRAAAVRQKTAKKA